MPIDDMAVDPDAHRTPAPGTPATSGPAHRSTGRLVVSWAVVGVPLAYGISQTLVKAAKLFTG